MLLWIMIRVFEMELVGEVMRGRAGDTFEEQRGYTFKLSDAMSRTRKKRGMYRGRRDWIVWRI